MTAAKGPGSASADLAEINLLDPASTARAMRTPTLLHSSFIDRFTYLLNRTSLRPLECIPREGNHDNATLP